MNKVQPRTPSGFNEYLPAEQIEFDRLRDIIRETYERYGFAPIDTPDLELSEVLLAKGGGETEQQIYRFTRGRNDLSLRFDLTVPLARYAAQHEGELVFPFRRYHIGKVHRAERAQKGRFREFYQCDIDIIGSKSPFVDAEFPAVINEIFERFNFGEFTIRINNRMVLNGFFDALGVSVEPSVILRIVDKMEKITRDELVGELKKAGLDDKQVDTLLAFVSISGDNDTILRELRELGIESELFNEGVNRLEILVSSLRKMKVPESRFKIDLKIARGLDYYTGTVYETLLNDHPEIGSVCSGGRYDNLVEYYTDTDLPGVGISIGLTRLFYKLSEAGIIKPSKQSPADVLVVVLNEEQIDYGLEISALLRAEGIPTVFYTEPNAGKKKGKYAARMGFRYVLTIGNDEVQSNTVALKDMETGEAKSLAIHEFIRSIH